MRWYLAPTGTPTSPSFLSSHSSSLQQALKHWNINTHKILVSLCAVHSLHPCTSPGRHICVCGRVYVNNCTDNSLFLLYSCTVWPGRKTYLVCKQSPAQFCLVSASGKTGVWGSGEVINTANKRVKSEVCSSANLRSRANFLLLPPPHLIPFSR